MGWAAQTYGLQTALIGKVGADSFGDMIIRRFARLGVSTCGIEQDSSVFTTLAFVTLDREGERSFSFARKPGADSCLRWEECHTSLIDRAKVFHFGSLSMSAEPSRTATLSAVKRAREKGKLITFDPNYRPALWSGEEEARAAMLWGLEQADVVKISDDEVRFLFGCDAEEGAVLLRDRFNVGLVFVTCGAAGAYFLSGDRSGFVPAPTVCPVDTTGAGDIFFGAAVSRLLREDVLPERLSEDSLRRITAFACAAASLSTERKGGVASIPSEDEVLSRLTD